MTSCDKGPVAVISRDKDPIVVTSYDKSPITVTRDPISYNCDKRPYRL
jgi:hypothetical protein